VHALIALTFLLSFDSIQISTPVVALTYALILGFFISIRVFYTLAIKRYRSAGRNFRNTIVVGHKDSGQTISKFILDNPSLGYKLLGFFDDASSISNTNVQFIGKTDDLESYVQAHKIDEIYCALPFSEHDKIQNLIRFADNNLIRLKLVPDFQGLIKRRVEIDFYDNTPVMTLRSEPLENFGTRLIKRIFDIIFSSLVITICAFTVFPIIALLIKSTSRGPVFFKQMRTGANKRDFMCLKFRTMVVNLDSDSQQAQQNDVRITKIGQFLRKTSLDELPQFINVLMGQMSVVGPRPHMLKHTEEYSRIIDQFMVRHFAKPGITGWAQVNGYRGNTTDSELMRKRVEYDVWYIENYTFLTDIKIIILTVLSMLKGDKNAY
jgi:Undecaprenyl-phosphate glucose phosphotransferase